ncbi:cytochrome P450 [Fomitopsis serialis]|uniref:cytochrome P450 n=1 Tax=Fomitopsis serialis TaxID=139415 RepID=UPI002008A9FE|nr:cytochrome P450 [Neoantrodia serialis]KAH9928825.1 cytochrome P450 [Neoantrodia serialis]
MSALPALSVLNALCGVSAIWVLSKAIQLLRRRARSTPLAGPPNPSFLLGASRFIVKSPDAGELYEEWSEKYGAVFRIPATLGLSRIALCDPKAVLHFYSRETYGYAHSTMAKRAIENLVGRGVLWAEGDSHKRQRKALTPAFSNAAIRRMTSVFYDSAYKVKTAWDSLLESEPGGDAVIDVQGWMNHVSLDTIGIAGFSHDFGTLQGKHSTVANTFDAFGTLKPSLLGGMQFAIGMVFPWVLKIPTGFRRLVNKLNENMGEIAQELLENTRKESEGESKAEEKSIIGLLIKAEKSDSELQMSEDEVLAQMKVLILAGYETTSISLTWCLLELCKKPEIQQKLREELSQFSGSDPTWDQFTNGLPYVDAVVHETLRLHPPLGETTRVATEDDIIPLSSPVRTPNGTLVDSIAVPKGQLVTVPIHMMNKCARFWGADAKAFRPERWLDEDGIPKRAQEIQGHRHLLTFVDGPRTCLGRHFALAEFKAVLSVLIRNYAFELRDGPDTKTEVKRGILPRPSIVGEEGARLPLRVRRLD